MDYVNNFCEFNQMHGRCAEIGAKNRILSREFQTALRREHGYGP